jgi:hypothetical protein
VHEYDISRDWRKKQFDWSHPDTVHYGETAVKYQGICKYAREHIQPYAENTEEN